LPGAGRVLTLCSPLWIKSRIGRIRSVQRDRLWFASGARRLP
jgi:hypothetical protein